LDEVLTLIPEHITKEILQLSPQLVDQLEEIRCRIGRPVELMYGGKPHFLDKLIFSVQDARALLGKLSHYSLYTLEEELRRGYVTISGGHRIGLAGKVITEESQVKRIRDVSSFNIRIARQRLGASRAVLEFLYQDHRWYNTLIIGPPQAGKTTLLRDIARMASQGEGIIPSAKVGIVDERSEIAGSVKGVPQHVFGPRVDVLDACPKAEGMMMLIRSMSPELIIIDEIGREEDSEALLEVLNAGVNVIASAHGYSYEQILLRPNMHLLVEQRLFDRFIILSRRGGLRVIEAIYNGEGSLISRNRALI